MNSTEIIIPFRIKFVLFKNTSRSFSFSHFFNKGELDKFDYILKIIC